MMTGPCLVCERITKAPTPSELICGRACAYLKERRKRYGEQGVKPGHVEYTPTTPEQRALHRTALKRKTND